MADYVGVDLSIRECDMETVIKALNFVDYQSERRDFVLVEWEDAPDDMNVYFRRFEDVSNGDLGVESILRDLLVPYDKSYGDGIDFTSGIESFRVVDGEPELKDVRDDEHGFVSIEDIRSTMANGQDVEQLLKDIEADRTPACWSTQKHEALNFDRAPTPSGP